MSGKVKRCAAESHATDAAGARDARRAHRPVDATAQREAHGARRVRVSADPPHADVMRKRPMRGSCGARILAAELGKLVRLPALWVFLALCLALNATISTQGLSFRSLLADTSTTARELGQRVDAAFLDGLAALPHTENRAVLLEAARSMENVFDGFSASYLADFYAEKTAASPLISQMQRDKYALMQARADHLARAGAALDLYAGPLTHDRHQALFGSLMPAIVAEGALVGALGVLLLTGYERERRTESALCTTRTGRGVMRQKALAGILAALALYTLLAALSLGLHFALWDYQGLWDASVSSGWNYLVINLIERPFVPWADLTVAQYLAASLAVGGGLVAAMSCAAAAFGALIKNAYLAALALAVLVVGTLVLAQGFAYAECWEGYTLLFFLPPTLWTSMYAWFTEGGTAFAVPWQETIGACVSLALAAGAAALALRRFSRKDVVS